MVSSTLETNNEMISKLQDNIVTSQFSNMISIPTECSQRDRRMGEMADAHTFAQTAMYNGDLSAFYTNWMRSVREAQVGGFFSDVSPR